MKKISLFFFLCFCVVTASAKSVDSKQIFECAERVLNSSEISVVEETRYYGIFRASQGKGYAIISLHPDYYGKLLGYSLNGTWNSEQMPPIITQWLKTLGEDNEVKKKATLAKPSFINNEKHDIAPMITCHWHQDSPYNDLSPVIADGDIKTAAGCVAIAASQIVYYWREYCPDALLMDTPVYPYGAAPVTVSIPKGTENNWDLMQDEYEDNKGTEESRHAVAQLAYALGTGAYLNYASSTGGSIYDVSNAMYAQYLLTSDYSSKSNYSAEEWESILYDNLSKGQPILYAGNASSSGHAFILHGYDSSNNLFYINFGWGGNGDGYYSLNEETGLGGYCSGQSCVYNIKPTYLTGINETNYDKQFYTTSSYNINGLKTNTIDHGVYIKRFANGQTKKILK